MNKYKVYVLGTLLTTAATLYAIGKPVKREPKEVEIVFVSQQNAVQKKVIPEVSTASPIPKLEELKVRYSELDKKFTKEDNKHMSSSDIKKLKLEVFRNTDLIVSRLEKDVAFTQ